MTSILSDNGSIQISLASYNKTLNYRVVQETHTGLAAETSKLPVKNCILFKNRTSSLRCLLPSGSDGIFSLPLIPDFSA